MRICIDRGLIKIELHLSVFLLLFILFSEFSLINKISNKLQVLNRDLWSNPGVKTIIREHFVFWQQYKEADEAERYMTFYKVREKKIRFK
jgi:hypothetical protein